MLLLGVLLAPLLPRVCPVLVCALSFCLFPWPNEPVVQNGALPSPTCCLELFLPKPQPAALSAPGPGSAKELIKSINEKFAGATGWEGTEPYPLASVEPVAAGMGICPSLLGKALPLAAEKCRPDLAARVPGPSSAAPDGVGQGRRWLCGCGSQP